MKLEGTKVVDIDSTYLEQKRQKLLYSTHQWHSRHVLAFLQLISLDHQQKMLAKMPSVSQSTLYTYLAECVGNVRGSMAFRAGL